MTTYVKPNLVSNIPHGMKYGINQIAEIGIKTKPFICSINFPNMKKWRKEKTEKTYNT